MTRPRDRPGLPPSEGGWGVIQSSWPPTPVRNEHDPALARGFQLAAELKEETAVTSPSSTVPRRGGAHPRSSRPTTSPPSGRGVRKAYGSWSPRAWGTCLCVPSWGASRGPIPALGDRVLHQKHTYKEYVGGTRCATYAAVIYGAYHHITVMGQWTSPPRQVRCGTGSLCESSDKFAIRLDYPEVEIGRSAVIHDTGAHGPRHPAISTRPPASAEVLLQEDGSARLIRRAETPGLA